MISEARLLTCGIALGAGLMYLLDPRQGGARRALIRDKSLRALHDVEGAAELGSRDMAHRVHGAVVNLRKIGRRDHVDDEVLVSRVRARLGHVCSHPHAVQVNAKGKGAIELKGPILTSQARGVVSAIAHVRGVRIIDDDLDRYDRAGDVPGLQGEPVKHAALTTWSTPAARFVLGLGAAALGIAALVQGNPLGIVAGGAAMLRLARSRTRGGQHLSDGQRRAQERAGTEKPAPRAPYSHGGVRRPSNGGSASAT